MPAKFFPKVVELVSVDYVKVHGESDDGRLEVTSLGDLTELQKYVSKKRKKPTALTAVVSLEEKDGRVHDLVVTPGDARLIVQHLIYFMATLGDNVAHKMATVIGESFEEEEAEAEDVEDDDFE